jgi:hypothetical protein
MKRSLSKIEGLSAEIENLKTLGPEELRPITSALQTGFNKVSQLGTPRRAAAAKPESVQWSSVGRRNKRSNLDSDRGQRVPAPEDVRGAFASSLYLGSPVIFPFPFDRLGHVFGCRTEPIGFPSM